MVDYSVWCVLSFFSTFSLYNMILFLLCTFTAWIECKRYLETDLQKICMCRNDISTCSDINGIGMSKFSDCIYRIDSCIFIVQCLVFIGMCNCICIVKAGLYIRIQLFIVVWFMKLKKNTHFIQICFVGILWNIHNKHKYQCIVV